MENVLVLTHMTTTATLAVSTIIVRYAIYYTGSQLTSKTGALYLLTYLLTPRVRCYCSSFVGSSGRPVLLRKTPICRVGRLVGAVVRYLARSDTFFSRVV